ncbi:hypothetical protein KC921_04165 [Candidatus Woesebacteria bacterium]|nr:hypothetical protein [Candidatus Woesebacteria bacterium]
MNAELCILTASSLAELNQHIRTNVEKGLVLWNQEGNRSRTEHLDGMVYSFNFLPALAKKTLHTRKPVDTCFLCEADPTQTVELVEPSRPKLRINNFPYHATQTLFSEKEHVPLLGRQTLAESLAICNKFNLNCAFSTHNSGASFPDHAHVHMFSSDLPLYDLNPVWIGSSPVKTGTIAAYPASILVIEGTAIDKVVNQFLYVLENIESSIFGYNFQYCSRNKRLFFFPRKTDKSEIFDGEIFGAPTVSGVFTPDARGYIGKSLEEAILLIEKRYKAINALKMQQAIRELIFPKEFDSDVIVPNLRQP